MAKGVERFFGDPTPIQKNYLVSDFLQDANDYEIEASVHVQVGVASGDELKETEWLQATGEREGLPTAVIAYCELDKPDGLKTVEGHAVHSRVRGVRQIVGRSDAEDAVTGSGALIDNVIWQANLSGLGELGLSFDLQLTPKQMPRMAEVLANSPNTLVALCHCGSPWDQSKSGLADWRAGLGLLASLPHVFCKISGFGMFDHHWTTNSIRPIVESCIEVFGAERCMFGSNFPVDKLHATYAQVWSAYDSITAGLSDTQRSCLFGHTARKFYRL